MITCFISTRLFWGLVSCGICVDGSRPGVRGRLGGPRQCLRVDILADFRQFAISNGNVEDPIVLERLIRGFDSPRSEADDQNSVALRYEFGGFGYEVSSVSEAF